MVAGYDYEIIRSKRTCYFRTADNNLVCSTSKKNYFFAMVPFTSPETKPIGIKNFTVVDYEPTKKIK